VPSKCGVLEYGPTLLGEIDWARRVTRTPDLLLLLDRAEHQVRAYVKADRRPVWEDYAAYLARRDADWDDVLGAIDDFLVALQAEHIRLVDEAGVSGRETNR